MTIKEQLSQILKFEEFVTNRALDLWNVNPDFKAGIDTIEYGEDEVYVKFYEITNHDCPDYAGYTLGIVELEMNEEGWRQYIAKKAEVYKAKEAARLVKEAQKTVESKTSLYNKLKTELGL